MSQKQNLFLKLDESSPLIEVNEHIKSQHQAQGFSST